jgi:Holliday junction resolvase RuvA-like protein
MKLFLSGLLTGALVICGAVVATKGALAGMFLLGCVAGIMFWLASVRLYTYCMSVLRHWPEGSSGEPALHIERAPVGRGRNRVHSNGMLPVVQQEVLSALMNLGMSFKQAEQAVREAASLKSGESFDELFRLAVGMKSKRAAA